jgi:hypothetical protein
MSAAYDVLNLAEKEYARPKTSPITMPVGEENRRDLAADRHTKELQQLVNRIFLAPRASAPRTLVFAGVNSVAGSGSTCARTALLLARQHVGPVCVLDGNFAAKELTSFYFPDKTPQPKGVGNFSREHCVPVEDNLWLAGDWALRNEHGRLLPVMQIQKHLEALSGIFHYLLIDADALLHSEDALTLAELAGAVVLMIEANVTLRRDAERASHSLQAQGVSILGAVLNNWSSPVPKGLNRLI